MMMPNRRSFLCGGGAFAAALVVAGVASGRTISNLVDDFGAAADGSRDVSEAVARALAAGGPVYVPNGVFLVAGTVRLPSGAVLFGEGGGARFIKQLGTRNSMFEAEDSEGVTLRGLTFDGRRSVGKVTGESVSLRRARRVAITDCNFLDGINLFCWAGTRDVSIRGNRFVGGRDGIAIGDTTVDGKTELFAENIRIADNHFEGILNEAVDVNADARNIVISANTIVDCSRVETVIGEAIDIGGDICTDVIVTGNTIDLAGRRVSGITVKINPAQGRTARISISGNTITNGAREGEAGIRIGNASDVVCAHNIVDGTDYGILTVGKAADLVLNANRITAHRRGLSLNNQSRNVIARGNMITATAPDGVGIFVDRQVEGPLITGNAIRAARPVWAIGAIHETILRENTVLSP